MLAMWSVHHIHFCFAHDIVSEHEPRADEASRQQTKSLSVERQRSFHIVHPDGHHGDAWLHCISTVPPAHGR